MNNQVINFLAEFIKRLFGNTPKFMNIIAGIGVAASFIGFLPDIITLLGINFPEQWNHTVEIILKIGGFITLIVAKLSTTSTPVAINAEGQILKTTDPVKMPFTATVEEKKVAKGTVKVESVEAKKTE